MLAMWGLTGCGGGNFLQGAEARKVAARGPQAGRRRQLPSCANANGISPSLSISRQTCPCSFPHVSPLRWHFVAFLYPQSSPFRCSAVMEAAALRLGYRRCHGFQVLLSHVGLPSLRARGSCRNQSPSGDLSVLAQLRQRRKKVSQSVFSGRYALHAVRASAAQRKKTSTGRVCSDAGARHALGGVRKP